MVGGFRAQSHINSVVGGKSSHCVLCKLPTLGAGPPDRAKAGNI